MNVKGKKILDGIFPAWGVCDFAALSDCLLPCKAAKDIPRQAASIIVAVFPYSMPDEKYKNTDLARFAAVPDYHHVINIRLEKAVNELKNIFPHEDFACFTDNSPVPEVYAAALAGLGVLGLNNLLIHPVYGSWVLIGEIVTTLKISADCKAKPLYCDLCGLCVNNCPADALGTAVFEKNTCLSHVTQSKKALSPEQERLIERAGCAWGCDICQLVCPMNAGAVSRPLKEFETGFRSRADLSEDNSDRVWAWRGDEVMGRNLRIIGGKE